MILNKQTMIISHSNPQDIFNIASTITGFCIFPLVTEAAVYGSNSFELILTEKKWEASSVF